VKIQLRLDRNFMNHGARRAGGTRRRPSW
jgi:hypothetical protein